VNSTQILSQLSRNLANAAPKEWDAFVQFFDAYATEVTVAVTQAEQNTILVQQGKAQAFLHLLKTFRECRNPPKQPNPQP